MPTLAALTFAATAFLGTTAAFADPSLGSGLPIGTTETSWESRVTAVGQQLQGIEGNVLPAVLQLRTTDDQMAVQCIGIGAGKIGGLKTSPANRFATPYPCG